MNKEYKACFVIPYFGKFPNYFSYFLSSAIYNSNFDFLFVTDIDYKFPDVSKHEFSRITEENSIYF